MLIALGVLSGLPDLSRRIAAERADKYVELVADEASWQQLASSVGQSPLSLLSALHQVGVNGVGVSEDTLASLQGLGLATMLSGTQWLGDLQAAGLPAPVAIAPQSTYAIVSSGPLVAFIAAGLRTATGVAVQQFNLPGARVALGVPLGEGIVAQLPLGFRPPSPGDAGAFGMAATLGMDAVPRPETGLVPMGTAQVTTLFQQIATSGAQVHAVLFAGASTQPIPGYPADLPTTAALLQQHGWNLAVIETAAQRGNVEQPGVVQVNAAMGQRTVRTYTVPPWMIADYTESQTATAILTSVEERNLRIVYLHPYVVGPNLEARTVQLYADVAQQLRTHGYVLAPPRPLPPVTVPGWQRVVQALAVTAAGLWLLEVLFPALRRYGYAPLVGLGILAVGLAAGSEHLTQLLVPVATGLGFGGLAVVYLAALWGRLLPGGGREEPAAVPPPRRGFLWIWTRAAAASAVMAGISLVGALIIATLLGDTTHFLEWQYFHGVKVTYLGIPFLAAWAFTALVGFGGRARPGVGSQLVWLGEQSVRYKHVALMLCVAGVGAVYLLRSGNVNSIPAIEQHMRDILERLVVARPREKEFLVGYPAVFLAMVALARRWRWWFLMMVIGASVAQVSLIDTFEHLRTPFVLSMERETLGLISGIITGTVALLIVWPFLRLYDRWRLASSGPAEGEHAWPGS